MFVKMSFDHKAPEDFDGVEKLRLCFDGTALLVYRTPEGLSIRAESIDGDHYGPHLWVLGKGENVVVVKAVKP